MRVRRASRDDIPALLRSDDLFDEPAAPDWTERFFRAGGHHLLVAEDGGGTIVGFASAIEMVHPDKGTEMMIYELGIAEAARGRGLATELVRAVVDLARELGCYGVWTATEPDNEPALRTYRRGGAAEEELSVVLVWPLGRPESAQP